MQGKKVVRRIPKKKLFSKFYNLYINIRKSNVFILLSKADGDVIYSLTPGMILKSGVTRHEYNQVSPTLRRRKKNLRAYYNTKKRTPSAILHALRIFLRNYKVQLCLQFKRYWIFNFSGVKLWLIKRMVRRWSRIKLKPRVLLLRLFKNTPHNGCKLSIRRRKKNKGRNRWRKRMNIA